MRTLLILLLGTSAAAAQAFQPPTATELFNLRSRCAALSDNLLDTMIVGSALQKSATSHYDPRTGHCYVDFLVEGADARAAGYFNRSLFDAHTRDVLAFAKIEKGKKVGMIFGQPMHMGDDLGFTDANEFIDNKMHD